MTNHVGQRLGNYRLMQPLGQGGFAEVYLGEHVFLGTYAAIKLLQVRLDDEERESFLREARTLAGLTHPNILRIIDFGVEATVPYLVMDYAPNGTLRQRHPRGSVLPISLILSYVRQIASALQYLHTRKLIHRDIKPENLLLGSKDEVLISDFGTATVFETLQSQGTMEMAGTLTYMAPEQIRGKPRPASDQYALAIVVYEWLTGTPPFKGIFIELSNLHMYATPPSLQMVAPGVSSEQEEVILTALAKDPDRRFATISAFANALEQASKQTSAPDLPSISYTIPAVYPSHNLASPSTGNSSFQQSSLIEDSPTIGSTTLPSLDKEKTVLTPQHTLQRDTQGQIPALHPEVAAPGPSSSILPPTLSAPEQYVWSTARPVQPPPMLPLATPEYGFIPPAAQPKQERRLSRRTVAFGLAGVVGLCAVGGLTFGVVSWLHGSAAGSGNSATPTPSLTRLPGKPYLTYTHHTGPVYALAWSAGANHIASGGKDQVVRVWDPTPPNGSSDLRDFLGQSGSVNAIAWSPGGVRVASGGSDNQVLVWDIGTGKSSIAYRHHTNNVRAVAWSPDGRYIASGGDDNTVQVWDALSAAPLYTFRGHTAMIWSLAWSPVSGATRIVSASADKTVQVWDALTGSNVVKYPGHTGPVKVVAWSPDGAKIASGGDDRIVHVWNSQTAQDFLTFSDHQNSVFTLAWSPDGQYIASGSWGEARVWKSATGNTLTLYAQQASNPQDNAVHILAWSPDGKSIASGGGDAAVNIWRAY